jgi:hypothetical protein
MPGLRLVDGGFPPTRIQNHFLSLSSISGLAGCLSVAQAFIPGLGGHSLPSGHYSLFPIHSSLPERLFKALSPACVFRSKAKLLFGLGIGSSLLFEHQVQAIRPGSKRSQELTYRLWLFGL